MITGRALVDMTVHGLPAPQGSKRPRPIYKGRGDAREFTGKVALVESAKEGVKTWRADVKEAAEAFLARLGEEDRERFPLDEPIALTIAFTLPRPKSHYRTGRNAHLLRDDVPIYHSGKPDLDKLLRATKDALTAAGVWRDDSRVAQYRGVAKFYTGPDLHSRAMSVPGARIWVWSLRSTVDGA